MNGIFLGLDFAKKFIQKFARNSSDATPQATDKTTGSIRFMPTGTRFQMPTTQSRGSWGDESTAKFTANPNVASYETFKGIGQGIQKLLPKNEPVQYRERISDIVKAPITQTPITNALNTATDFALQQINPASEQYRQNAENIRRAQTEAGTQEDRKELLRSYIDPIMGLAGNLESKGAKAVTPKLSEVLDNLMAEAKKFKTADEFSKMQNKADFLKEKFQKTRSGDDLRRWRKAQNEVESFQNKLDEKNNEIKMAEQRILDEEFRKADASIDNLSKEDLSFLTDEAKKTENLDVFIGRMRGSATQYGDYAPKLRKYVRPKSKFVGDIEGLNPKTKITVYRGLDIDNVGNKQIRNGDFVTTDYDDALQYTNSPGKVVSKKVRLENLVAEYPDEIDISNPKNPISYELIYNPTRKINQITDSKLIDIWNKANSK